VPGALALRSMTPVAGSITRALHWPLLQV